MELTEFRTKSKKGKKKRKKAKVTLKKDDDEEEDEETKRLSSELMQYVNEQDEAEMHTEKRAEDKPR